MVIAWEPLATGLESKQEFRRLAEFKCWLSLYCHKRWQRGAMRALRDQFRQLFISEWIYVATIAIGPSSVLPWSSERSSFSPRAADW